MAERLQKTSYMNERFDSLYNHPLTEKGVAQFLSNGGVS